jgi:hypothetical protein
LKEWICPTLVSGLDDKSGRASTTHQAYQGLLDYRRFLRRSHTFQTPLLMASANVASELSSPGCAMTRVRRLHVPYKFQSGWLLDGQVRRFCTLEDFVDEDRGTMVQPEKVWTVGNAQLGISYIAVDRRHLMLCRSTHGVRRLVGRSARRHHPYHRLLHCPRSDASLVHSPDKPRCVLRRRRVRPPGHR